LRKLIFLYNQATTSVRPDGIPGIGIIYDS